jgi:hypothetical protein
MHRVPADGGYFGLALGFAGLALLCSAFAWDGLVRQRLLLPAFPFGASLGDQALLVKRVGSVLIGVVATVLGLGCWLLTISFVHLGSQRCGGSVGCLLGSGPFPLWVWFGLWVIWFSFVWVRMGDPRKRVLVYGVWYHQARLARQTARHLREQGLAAVPQMRLYALEDELVRLLHTHGWLAIGHPRLADGRPSDVQAVAPADIPAIMLQEPAFHGVSEAEREAIRFLLTQFLALAERAEHMSRWRRWWVGTAQVGKLAAYGRRAL